MKVLLAGSRRLPAGQAPRLLIRFLAALPEDATILLRKGMYTEPGRFERDAEALCSILRMLVAWRVPKPTDEIIGRSATFVRDVEAIAEADLTLLFLHAEDSGLSGTAHLMDQALQQGRPVYTYALSDDGTVTRVGEYDPDHLYDDLAPSARG